MPILNHTNRSVTTTTKSSAALDTLSTYLVFTDCSNQLLKHRRTHGLQFPLHFQQVVGWAASGFFVIVLFGAILPKFATSVQWISYAIFIPLIVIYTISHFLVVFLDPVEKSLRSQPKQKINSLNRVRNSHVIENGYCNLCLIETTSQRTKHCRACNKCVVRFDHHCKWLNQCVGERNYVPFLMCVISASIISVLLIVLIMAEVVLYFWKPDWLQSLSAHQHDLAYNSTFMDLFFNTDNNDVVFLIIIAIVGILATVSAALLIHLCFFHFYITCRGLTTYEYIRTQRGQSITKIHAPKIAKISVPIRRTLTLENLRLTKSALVLCSKQESVTSNTIPESVATTSNFSNHSTIDPSNSGVKNLKTSSDEPMNIVSKKLRGTKRWSCCVSVPDSPDDPISFTISRQPFQDKNRWNAVKKFFHFRFGRRNNNQIVPFKASDSFDGLSHLSAYNISSSELPMLPPPTRKKLTMKPNQIQRANTEPIFSQMLLNDYFPHSATYTNSVYKHQAPMSRRRRVNYMPNTRQKTPTLSPIKESGYSNPSSPSKKSIISVSTVSCD